MAIETCPGWHFKYCISFDFLCFRQHSFRQHKELRKNFYYNVWNVIDLICWKNEKFFLSSIAIFKWSKTIFWKYFLQLLLFYLDLKDNECLEVKIWVYLVKHLFTEIKHFPKGSGKITMYESLLLLEFGKYRNSFL